MFSLQNRDTIAYFTGTFPAVSETFVYREVLALRSRGWRLEVVSLRRTSDELSYELMELQSGATVLYRRPLHAMVNFVNELGCRPRSSLTTLKTILLDLIFPGEETSLTTRIKLLAQGLSAIAAANQLRRQQVGHIHCHFAHAPTSVGMYAALQLGVPFSFTGHANDLFQRRSLLRRKLERAAFVSCISEWHRRFYSTIYADKGRYRLIRCGVPLDRWFPTKKAHGEESVHVLTVGRLVQKKGIDTLIRGLSLWGQRACGQWKLTVAGDGPERSGLETLSKELGCHQQIGWLGTTDNGHVRDLMRDAGVFALPCRADEHGDRDGIPVAVMEAMACGVPVIVGDLPAIRELVSHGINGLLCDGDKPESVASCLAVLARSDAERQRLGNAGRQRVVEEFSLEQNIERLEHALCESFKHVQKESREPLVA